MNLKSDYRIAALVVLLFTILLFTRPVSGQTTPLYPISYRVFNPFIFNPAIAGSKDYFSADVLAGKNGDSNYQLLSGSARLGKTQQGFFTSPGTTEFSKIGIGGSLFNEMNGVARNTGISATGSYHLQLDKSALSFLSFGVTVKGVYNDYSGNTDLSDSARSTFFPNIDAGIYYYGTNLFAGVSITNILGSPESEDSLRIYNIPVSSQLFFQLGYKLVISRSLNLIIEPSVIVNSNLTFSGEIKDMIEPMLKVYAGNFCAGTYFYDFDKYSFFFQYKYPKFYIGTYFELTKGSPFYKSPILGEVALGINLSAVKHGSARFNHW
jgi:type IX secretion system PorP/SprF family membrane protein